jgi:DNA-binding transcriptional MerR regulator
MKMDYLSIGEVARQSGLAVSAIRYYEECGLLPTADRQANNRRCYGGDTLDSLHFISACRKNGMGLSAIADLQKKLNGQGLRCEGASKILDQVVRELTLKIADLQQARKHLSKVSSACNADNCGQTDGLCNVEVNMKASA